MTEDQAMIQYFLSGLNFPAGRGQILAWAKSHNAPPLLIQAIQLLPEESYGNFLDLREVLEDLLEKVRRSSLAYSS